MGPEDPGLGELDIIRFHLGEGMPARDVVAREEPLEIRLNGTTLVYLMRLPGDDPLLAAGFCFSEGIIGSRDDIELLRHCTDGEGPAADGERGAPGNLVEVTVRAADGAERFESARIVRTGCGGADLERELDLSGIDIDTGTVFPTGVLTSAPGLLLEGQEVFRATGATHGACVFDAGGRAVVVKEDVGRHNAVDKVLGHLLMSGIDTSDKGLVLSGRLSYEMVLKAARARIPLVCSVSAPTELGVEVGRRTGVTVVGFLRGNSFNVYTHPERVGGGA